jgi:hypothetical protein
MAEFLELVFTLIAELLGAIVEAVWEFWMHNRDER